MLDEIETSEAALKRRIAELESALSKIAKMKAEPIGDTGFLVGPLSLFQACQRTAREALKCARK